MDYLGKKYRPSPFVNVTYSSEVPSKETVRSVIQEDFYHNFSYFRSTAIYQIIMAKRREALACHDDDAS